VNKCFCTKKNLKGGKKTARKKDFEFVSCSNQNKKNY